MTQPIAPDPAAGRPPSAPPRIPTVGDSAGIIFALIALIFLALLSVSVGEQKEDQAAELDNRFQSAAPPSSGPLPTIPIGPNAAAWQRAMLNSDPRLPGTYVPPHPGRDGRVCSEMACVSTMDDREHLRAGERMPICTEEQVRQGRVSSPPCYTSNPPTSGLHAATATPLGVLEDPGGARESLVHNMEHGAVVVWYNTADESLVALLRQIVRDQVDRRRMVVLTRYTEMEPETVALTAWTRLDKFKTSEFTAGRVLAFIQEHQRRFNPEGF